MKASQQLRTIQNLKMTPQLRQAIRLLQLSNLELQQEVQQILESNPMLELDSPYENNDCYNSENSDSSSLLNRENANQDKPMEDLNLQEDTPTELSLDIRDTRWEEKYSSKLSYSEFSNGIELWHSTKDNLKDHLEWQLNLSKTLDRNQKLIGLAIIESVAPDGYLQSELKEIQTIINTVLKNTSLTDILKVKQHIQQFDPPGCASKSLQDCLLAQLEILPNKTNHYKYAEYLIKNFLNELGKYNYTVIKKKSLLSDEQIQLGLKVIKSLNPKPGLLIGHEEPPYILPDLELKKEGGVWVVELNKNSLPRLHINPHYTQNSTIAHTKKDSDYIKNKLQEAHFILKSLHNRHATLLRVTNCIVQKQLRFFDHGEEAMEPLTLTEIAQETLLHESTISRATTQKYIQTPQGIFPLKYFFSSQLITSSGKECSSTAIRACIKKLISSEDQKKPLSDSKVAKLLDLQGYKIARRTVAKYREFMKIGSSSERKGAMTKHFNSTPQ